VVVGLLKSRRTTTRPSLRDGVPATSGPTAAAIVGRIAVAHAERCRKAVDDPAQRRFRRLDSLVTLIAQACHRRVHRITASSWFALHLLDWIFEERRDGVGDNLRLLLRPEVVMDS